jgi:hypothetical protein
MNKNEFEENIPYIVRLEDQILYDIKNMDSAMYIPKEFEIKVLLKSVIDKIDKTDVIVIYFDEEKWSVNDINNWSKCIHEFCERSLLMLPKSFSSLQSLTNKQLMDLKYRVDKAVEQAKKMESENNG